MGCRLSCRRWRGRMLVALGVLLLAPLTASAQYEEVKWDQPPFWTMPTNVYLGWNEESWTDGLNARQIAADDWVCTTADPITDVHWWGSYIGWVDEYPPLPPEYFRIVIWTDVPADPNDPTSYSHPGDMIWTYDCYDYAETFYGWDFDPRVERFESCFYYTCDIPMTDWFYQEPGTNIYWVSIIAVFPRCTGCAADLNGDGAVNIGDAALMASCIGQPPTGNCASCDLDCDGDIDVDDESIFNCLLAGNPPEDCCPLVYPDYEWGWKTRPRGNSPAPDAAVRIWDPVTPDLGEAFAAGEPITWPGPYPDTQWDLAFELTSQEMLADIKWDQPPEPDNPYYPGCFYGWDELSEHGGPQIAGDDWVCSDNRPVTDIHWWGSYIGWQDPNEPPMLRPSRWVFTIWTDTPAGLPDPFSHPATAIWQTVASAAQVTETKAGCDYHPDHGLDTCFYYTFDIPHADWFYQEPDRGIFWLTIAPIYECACNGDQDGDGDVDDIDMAAFVDCVTNPRPGCEWADMNCDGTLDALDMSLFDCQYQAGWPDPNCCADIQPPVVDHPWGWKTRPYMDRAPDAAVRVFDPTAPVIGSNWNFGEPIIDMQEQWWDLAFQLTTLTPGEPYVKWSQPPEPWDNAMIDGWDEWSVRGSEQIAADDWVCEDSTPVTDIHWWGSFLGWDHTTPPTNMLPQRFHVAIWSDVPAGTGVPWSHPGVVLHTFYVTDYTLEFVGWDLDPCGLHPPESCFRFDYEMPFDDWFIQPTGTHVYWVSIAADYGGTTPPPYPFGWKTREMMASAGPDAAVRIFAPTTPVNGSVWAAGEPLACPAGGVWYDLAFTLTTCRSCGDTNCDGVTDVFDIDSFVMAIVDPAMYAVTYPGCDIMEADCDFDLSPDLFDIDSFVAAMINYGCPNVP